jgi:hypothetical protein
MADVELRRRITETAVDNLKAAALHYGSVLLDDDEDGLSRW